MINSMILCIGSNVADREHKIKSTIEWLCRTFDIVNMSRIYESADDTNHGSSYINAVIAAETSKSYESTITTLKDWEKSCGRIAESKSHGLIPIDLDIVIWNCEIIRPTDFNRVYFKQGYEQLLNS